MESLIIDIIIQWLDYLAVYSICHNIMKKKPDVSYKDILFGFILGIILGLAASFTEDYWYKLIATIGVFFVMQYLTKKKIHDLLIIYTINLLFVLFVQIFVILIMQNVDLKEDYWFLIAQIMTTGGALFLNYKTPLYRLFLLIEKEIVLKLFIFIITSIFLIGFVYSNFNLDVARPYILYFTILVFVSLLGLYRTIKYVLFYTNKMPVQLHDVKNVLMGLHISIQGKTDINEIKHEVNNALTVIGIDTFSGDTNVEEQVDKILLFVNRKRDDADTVTLITDIRCYEENKDISLSIILYMLGVLLDNAIESSTKKEIEIKVYVSEEGIFVSVSNEYERTNDNDFEKMFQTGYSTKSSQSKGFGLPHLSEIVTKYNGEIQLKHTYNEEQQCDYLTLIITIGNYI